ncbi:MAG: hypothetical protein ACRBBW_11985 [Cellvibrionaceae bacterium]
MLNRLMMVVLGSIFIAGCSEPHDDAVEAPVAADEVAHVQPLINPQSVAIDRVGRDQLIEQWQRISTPKARIASMNAKRALPNVASADLKHKASSNQWRSSFPLAFYSAGREYAKQFQYLLVGNSFSVGLSDQSMTTAFIGGNSQKEKNPKASLLQWKFLHANDDTSLLPRQTTKANMHRYVGVRKQWRSHLDRHRQVLYRDLYPGVDLLFDTGGDILSYAFFLERADASQKIEMQVNGAKSIVLNSNGDLIVETEQGVAVHSAPKAFEVIGGHRKPVAIEFRLKDKSVSFHVEYQSPDSALVIDPEIEFLSYLGGEANESTSFDVLLTGQRRQTIGIAATDDAQVLVASKAASPRMLLGEPGSIAGLSDAFLLSFNPDYFNYRGTDRVNYMTFYGGSGVDFATDVVVDDQQRVYVSGYAQSSDIVLMPGTVGEQRRESGAFILQLDASGQIENASTIGRKQPFYITSLAIEAGSSESIYIAGHAAAPIEDGNAEGTEDAYYYKYRGGSRDGFVAKLNSQFTQYDYLTFLGGEKNDYVHDIAVGRGVAHVVGKTNSPDFPVSEFAHQSSIAAPLADCDSSAAWVDHCYDGFVTALNRDGSELVFSSFYGTEFPDSANGIAISESRRISIVGRHKFSGASDTSEAYVAQFGSDGALLGESGFEGEFAIAEDVFVSSANKIYMTGTTDRMGLEDDLSRGSNGGVDLFYAGYQELSFNRELFRYQGGSGSDYGHVIDGYGGGDNVCLVTAGVTYSADVFTRGALPDSQRYGGAGDLLIAGWCHLEGDEELPSGSFLKEGPQSLAPGESGSYVITVNNDSGEMSGVIQVEDQISDLLTIESYSSLCVRGLDNQRVSCEMAALGAVMELTINISLAGDVCEQTSIRSIENTAELLVEGFSPISSNTVITRIDCSAQPACPVGQTEREPGVCCEDVDRNQVCDDLCPAEMGLPFSVGLESERCGDGEVCGRACTEICDGIEIGNNCWFGDSTLLCPKFSCQAPSNRLQLHEYWQDR